MQLKWKAALAGSLALALAGCGGTKDTPAADATGAAATPAASSSAAATPAATTAAAAPAAGAAPAAFAQCAACHSTEAGKTLVGPSLAGVAGRKAGSVAGFAYSDGLKAAGLTWDDATLDKWLTAPAKLVPGTKMPFAGIPDAATRQSVIDYLKTLK